MNQNGLAYLVAKLWNHQVVIQSFLIGPWSLLHYLHIRISILPNVRGESKRTSLLSRQVVKPPGSNPTFSVGPFLISSSLLFSKQLTDLMKTYWRWDSNRRSLVLQATADQPRRIIWPKMISGSCQTKIRPVFYLYSFGCSGKSCGLGSQWPPCQGVEREEKIREAASLLIC